MQPLTTPQAVHSLSITSLRPPGHLEQSIRGIPCQRNLGHYVCFQGEVEVLHERSHDSSHLPFCKALPHAIPLPQSEGGSFCHTGKQVCIWMRGFPSLGHEFHAITHTVSADDVEDHKHLRTLRHGEAPDSALSCCVPNHSHGHWPHPQALLDHPFGVAQLVELLVREHAPRRVDNIELLAHLVHGLWVLCDLLEDPREAEGCRVVARNDERDEVSKPLGVVLVGNAHQV
mmetsp:Transcript_16453/g.40180  ORF Transcript_16453/g.40180 Transcript_16453/m.40180 type:complete len:230 (-) Transcript_16453:895-1584(-)